MMKPGGVLEVCFASYIEVHSFVIHFIGPIDLCTSVLTRSVFCWAAVD